MTFQISTFAFILVSLILFYSGIARVRLVVSIAASLIFCYAHDKLSAVVLLLVTLITYSVGILLNNKQIGRKRRYICLAAVSSLVIFLLFWKHVSGFTWCGSQLIIPMGLSFYTFQAVSYLVDVYRGKYEPEKRLDRFLLYMTWFPKLTSGPIERADQFLEQTRRLMKVKLFDGQRLISALSYVIWGLFLKLMIADRTGVIVDGIFVKYEQYGSIMLLAGSLLYTIQIYCDFAGYTDIAIGISCLFGLDLTQNFKTPYLSQNITEFWRSWHISLSNFLRDYIYIPLGGNQKGEIRKYINIMIVFLICGAWHGKGFKFIIWGALHGFYSIIAGLIKGSKISFLLRGVTGRILTFGCVSFAWIFFRAESLGLALRYVHAFFTSYPINQNIEYEIIKAGSTPLQVVILLAALVILFIFDSYAHNRNVTVPDVLIAVSEAKRDTMFLFLAVTVLIFGIYGNEEVKSFIYMSF